MGFKDAFLHTGKTYADAPVEVVLTRGFSSNEARLQAMQRVLGDVMQRGATATRAQVESSEAMRSELAYQATAIQDQMRHGSDAVCRTIHDASWDVIEEIQRLSDYLGAGLASIRWAVERHAQTSAEILATLLNSLDNESRQYFHQGVKCYESGEFAMAEERFQKALGANRTNYYAYQYLGFIAVETDHPEEAIRYFELAHKFAEEDYHRGLALSHLARCYHAQGDDHRAWDLSRQATQFCPKSGKLWYETSVYAVRAGFPDSALHTLENSIYCDWTYWAVSLVDADFEPLRPALVSRLAMIRERERTKALAQIDRLERTLQTARRMLVPAELLEAPVAAASEFAGAARGGDVFTCLRVAADASICASDLFAAASKAISGRHRATEAERKRIKDECQRALSEERQALHEALSNKYDLDHRRVHWGPGWLVAIPATVGWFFLSFRIRDPQIAAGWPNAHVGLALLSYLVFPFAVSVLVRLVSQVVLASRRRAMAVKVDRERTRFEERKTVVERASDAKTQEIENRLAQDAEYIMLCRNEEPLS
jgi:tetratricopeptide (TPR) repeat protein